MGKTNQIESLILTPFQVEALIKELEEIEGKIDKARVDLEAYLSDRDRRGTLDDSYYESIAKLVERQNKIENMLSDYVLAKPIGNMVQIGSIVELADTGKKIMLVEKCVTNQPGIKEVQMDAPIFGGIYFHKTGDICVYENKNGKKMKCVIGKVDNETCNKKADEIQKLTANKDPKTLKN